MTQSILDRLDSGLFEKLSDLARVRNVSVEDQIISVLQEALQHRQIDRVARAKAIAAMTPKGIKQTDSTILIREDRDR